MTTETRDKVSISMLREVAIHALAPQEIRVAINKALDFLMTDAQPHDFEEWKQLATDLIIRMRFLILKEVTGIIPVTPSLFEHLKSLIPDSLSHVVNGHEEFMKIFLSKKPA